MNHLILLLLLLPGLFTTVLARLHGHRHPIKTEVLDEIQLQEELGLEKDLLYLDRFRYHNDHIRVNALFAEELKKWDGGPFQQKVPFQELVVEKNAELHRLLNVYPYSLPVMIETMEPVVGHMVNKASMEIIALNVLAKAMEPSKLIEDGQLAKSLVQYDDAWKMDSLVASLVGQGRESADVEAFNKKMKEANVQIEIAQKEVEDRREFPFDGEKWLENFLGPAFYKTYKFRNVMAEARKTIEEELEMGGRYYDIDERMITLLEPMENEKLVEMYRGDMELARQTLQLEIAVRDRRMFAVRALADWNVSYPKIVYRDIVRQAVQAGDVETVKILIQHPSFSLDSLQWLLDPVRVRQIGSEKMKTMLEAEHRRRRKSKIFRTLKFIH